jgi:hypothetical protein
MPRPEHSTTAGGRSTDNSARLPVATRGAASARCRGPWGDPLPLLPSALAQAALEGDLAGKVQVLEANPMTPLERALASLGRALAGRDS